MPERESLVTFLLEPFAGGTELTLIHEHLPDERARSSHEEGWTGFLAASNLKCDTSLL